MFHTSLPTPLADESTIEISVQTVLRSKTASNTSFKNHSKGIFRQKQRHAKDDVCANGVVLCDIRFRQVLHSRNIPVTVSILHPSSGSFLFVCVCVMSSNQETLKFSVILAFFLSHFFFFFHTLSNIESSRLVRQRIPTQ